MGTKGRTPTDSALSDRVALLEDALHRTRQRCDLLMHAVEEIARMYEGRGLDRAEVVESLLLHGAPATAALILDRRLLEPDHPETHEPQVLPRSLMPGAPEPASPVATRARLAGARFAFDGTDPLGELREEAV